MAELALNPEETEGTADQSGQAEGERGYAWQRQLESRLKEIQARERQRHFQATKQAALKKAQLTAALPEKLKKVQLVLDLVKGISLLTSFTGVSLVVFLVTANVELFVLPFFIPWWKQAAWRRVTIIVINSLVIFLTLMLVGFIMYAKENPAETCAAIGGTFFGTLGETGGWIAGKLGFCSVLPELFNAIL